MMTRKVSISSVKASLLWLRRLAAVLILLFAAQGVWGDAYTWKGLDTNPGNINNWKTETDDPATNYPGSSASDTVLIPSGLTYYPSVASSLINNITSVKIDGELTITDDFILAKIDTASEGTLIVNGKLINNSTNDVSSLAIQCTDFVVNGSLKCKSISMSSSSKIDGTLTIADDFTLSNIDTDSTGTLIVNGKLTNNSEFIATNLSITCGSLNMTNGLKGYEIIVNGTTEITSTSWLVATNTAENSAGITFGGNVTVDASGDQFVLAGKVNAKESETVTIAVTHGLLNHVQEGGVSAWTGDLTVDLQNDACSFGLQSQSYKIKVSANSDDPNDPDDSCDVYFVGNGTISSMDFPDSGVGCNIHFGNTDEDPNHANTITIGDDIEFNTTGGIVINKSCKGLIGSVTLLKINSITNESTQLTGAIEPTFSLNDSATISGSGISFAAITCSGNATISGTNTISKLTATGLSGNTLTINGTTTIGSETSLSGTDSSNLIISGSGSFTVLSDLSADYITLSATAPEVTGGTIYAQHSNAAGSVPDGWVLSANALHVWKGGAAGNVSDWHTDANWLPASVPSGGDVIINATTNNPVISTGNIALNSITIETDAKLTVDTDSTLTLETGCELDNKIEGAGTLILAAGQTYTIPTGNEYNINIKNNGTLSEVTDATGTVTLKRSFTNKGTASFGTDVTVSVTGDFTNDTSASATFTGGLALTGDFTDSGTSFSGTVTLNGTSGQEFKGKSASTTYNVIFAGSGIKKFSNPITIVDNSTNSYEGNITFSASGNQTFTAQSAVYQNITVNKSGGTLTVDGNLNVKTLDLTDGEVTFNGNLTLTDGANLQSVDFRNIADTITFSGGTAVSPNVLTAAGILSSTKISADYLKLNGTTIQLTSTQNINHLTLKGSTSVTVNGITAQTLSIDSLTPVINLSGTISHTSTTEDFVIDSPVNLTGDTTFSVGKGVTFNNTVTSSNSLSVTATKLTFGGDVSVKDLTMNAAATTDKNITVTGNWTNNNSFTASGGIVTFTGEYPSDGQSSVILSGDNTFKSLVIQDSIQISGSNEIETLTANNLGGKTITFGTGKTQTITTLNLSGTATPSGETPYNPLTLTSTDTWNLVCPATSLETPVHTLQYLSVKNSNSTYVLAVTNCTDGTGNENWIFVGQNYKWEGTTDNSWGTATNWTPASVPGKGAVVVIQSGKPKYPSISSAIDLYYNDDNPGSITNNGTITFSGGTLTATTKENGSGSTIIYNGTTTPQWQNEYQNLTITNGNALTLSADTTVNALLTNNGTITNSAGLTVTNLNSSGTISGAGNQHYQGAVTLSGTATVLTSSSPTGTIKFDSTINGTTDGEQTLNITASETTFAGVVGGEKKLSALSVTGAAKINCASITTTDGQIYNDDILLYQNSSLTGSLVTLNGSVSDNQTPPATSYELTINGNATTALGDGEAISIPVQINGSLTNENTGTASFNNDIKVTVNVTDNGIWNSADGKKLIFNGTGAQAQVFTPVETTTYKSILINKSNGSFTTSTNALSVTTFADSNSNASSITFATYTTIKDTVEFNTSKDVSFAGTETVIGDTSTLSYSNLTHAKGITNLKGFLTAANITLHKANLTDTTRLIAHGDVAFVNIGTSSYANVYGAKDLTITVDNGKSVTFNGDVGKSGKPVPKSLTINGTTNIKCTLIATTENQVYDGDINISTSSEVKLTTDSTHEVDFSGNITQSATGKKLILNTPTFKSTKTTGASSVSVTTIELAQDVTFNSASGGGVDLSVSQITQTEGSRFTFVNNAKLKQASSEIIIDADIDFSSGSFDANGGTVTLTGTTAAGTSQTLTTKTDGSTQFNNLVIKGNVKLNNSNKIVNLTADTPAGGTEGAGLSGKTITFGSGTTQTISGTLKLKGVEGENNRLKLLSSTEGSEWMIQCTGDEATVNHSIQYVEVQDSKNISAYNLNPYNLTATASWDLGNNTNWNFPLMPYTWTGADATDCTNWNVAKNWSPQSIPNIGAYVTIPATGIADGHYPDITGTIVLDDASHKGKVTNNGTITFSGGTLTATTKENGSGSTIIYNGTTTPQWQNEYQNLTITNGNALTLSADTTVNALLTNNGTITNNAVLTVKNFNSNGTIDGSGNQSYSGTVNLNGATELKTTGASGTISFLENSTVSGAANLTVNGTCNISSASISSSGELAFNNNINLLKSSTLTASKVTFGGDVTSTADNIALTVNGTSDIKCDSITTTGDTTFKGNIGSSNDKSLTTNGNLVLGPATMTVSIPIAANKNLTNKAGSTTKVTKAVTVEGNFINESSLEAASISVTGTSELAGSVKTTGGNQTYTGDATISDFTIVDAAQVLFKGIVTGKNETDKKLTITKATGTTFEQNVILNTITDTADSGTITFSAGGTITNAFTRTAGETFVSGTLTCNNAISLKALTINADSSITGTSITTGEIKAKTAGNLTLTLTSTDGTFNTGNVGSTTNAFEKVLYSTGTENANLVYNATGTRNIYATDIEFKSNGNITVSDIIQSGKTTVNTSKTITLENIQTNELVFANTDQENTIVNLNGNINVQKASNNLQITAKTINVTGSLSVPATSTISLTAATSFTGTGDSSISGGSLTVTGSLVSSKTSSATQTFSLPVTVNGPLTNSGTSVFGGDVTVDGSLLNNSSCDVTFNGDVSVTGNVTDSGTWTQTAHNLIFTGGNPQEFEPSNANGGTLYHSVQVLKTGGSFATKTNPFKAESFADSTGSTTNACPITLNTDTTIQSDVVLKTPAAVTFAAAKTFTFKDSSDNYTDFSHTTGNTDINGNFYAKDISFKTVTGASFTVKQAEDITVSDTTNLTSITIENAATTTFNGAVTIATFNDEATAGAITFNAGGTISNTNGTTFSTNDTVSFGDNQTDIMTFGNSAPFADLTHTAGSTSITGLLNAANITLAQTTGGPMTISNSGLLTTTDGSSLTYTTDFTQIGPGNSKLGGSFGGTGNANFATNVQLYGTVSADFGAASTSINIGNNLIIIREASAPAKLDILSNVNATENIVLYKGQVTASANISAGKDILILGEAYSTTDTSTGITNEYAYACVRPETWSQINYAETLLPDGTATTGTTDFTSTLSVSSGITITAAKNFYANGTSLSTNGASGQWILKVPDLTNAANGFAEAYHSEISGLNVVCADGSTDGTKARLVCLECTDLGTNAASVDFDDFVINAAWTERDNSIRVEFNRPVRYYNQTVQTLKFQNAGGEPSLSFTGLYSDPDCQDEIKYDTEMSYFYIKAVPQNDSQYGAWNTDATGRSSGADDDQSTDRSGIHHENIPALDFARALVNNGTTQAFIFTDRWGKRLNNYSSRTPTATAAYGSTEDTEVTHEVADKTGPVLYSVRTGQELHNAYDTSTGQASEHSYDSHNFIEFRYSEPVDFDGDATSNAALNADPTTAENVQVTDDFGALKNSDITAQSALTIAGLGIIQNGLIHTGKAGSTDKYVNALYRKDPYSINLSIAGYTEGTITDPNGNEYKNWTGYIEQAAMPTGTVTYLLDSGSQNSFVKDKQGNVQIKYPVDSCNTIPVVNSTEQGLYGAWDISEPVFAPVRPNKKTAWNLELFQKNYSAEAVGNNSGVGSTLDRIEFHLYDNTPEFDELGNAAAGTPEWFTEVGWCIQNSEGEKATDLYKSYTYAADIFGGARPYDNDTQRRTSGGIRYSTVHSAVNAFKYGIGSAVPENLIKTAFDNSKNTWDGASSLVFTGSSSPRRSAGDLEGLYFALPLENTSLDIKTSFTIKYDDSVGFITDLAGNRLRSKVFSTIDRTPPSIDMTVCPVGGDELEIIFVKELCIDSEDLHFVDNSGDVISITEPFDVLVNKCFDFITIDSSGQAIVSDLKIKEDVPAQISIAPNPDEKPSGPFFTKIHFKLSRTVTLEDIKNTYIRVTCIDPEWEYSTDKFTGHPGARVTLIQDANETGNNLQMYTAHAMSDFAVGVINPLYAYDTAMTNDDGEIISDALFHKNLTDDVDTGSWAVHDWNRDQQNYGTLPAKRPVAVVADTFDGTEANENAPANFNIYLSNKPDTGSVSTQYNKDLEPSPEWRIWLPSVTADVFTSLSEKNNTNYSQAASALLQADKNSRLIFDVDKTITDLWAAGNQISFLFGLTNSDGSPVTIMHAPELDINHDKQYLTTSVKSPLYALRQTDSKDLLSLDLWSFRLKSNIMQRGGVSILNNVIDSSVGEKVVVRVDLEAQGKLEVLVMTLDGNIVDYLHRGVADKGEHFYSWDGSNRKGNPVARGMYFIRVIGDGIDETRKVMVVKE